MNPFTEYETADDRERREAERADDKYQEYAESDEGCDARRRHNEQMQNDMNTKQTSNGTPYGAKQWAVAHEHDKFDSRQNVLRVIDTSDNSLSHPQGPLTIATVNVAAYAPHVEFAEANARLMAAAPELLEACRRLLVLVNDLMPGVQHMALRDYRELNEAPIAALQAIGRATSGDILTPTDGITLPLELCAEYDAAANWCAVRGLKGNIGDPLPPNMAEDGALKYIQADPEAFQERVRQSAYAIRREGTQ